MKNFQNPLTNEDPLAKELELESLQYWPIATVLILSNFFGWPAIILCVKKRRWVEASAIAIAVLWSLFYHICQSTTYCFTLNLTIWTMSDHISAPAMMAMLIILIVNPRIITYVNPLLTSIEFNVELNTPIKHKKRTESDQFYDAWISVTTYCYIFLVILATFAHPFSMQNFVIVISFGLSIVFIKLVIIDECRPENLEERISLPDLIVGTILIGISLIFFVLDSWLLYWIFHSLWHAFSFSGVYFFIVGMTNDTKPAYSPTTIVYQWLKKSSQNIISVV